MGAPQTETLLLQVDINANTARLAELAAEARKAKAEFETLRKQVAAGAADAALLDSASVKLKATLAANSQEARTLTKANQDQLTVLAAQEGSLDQLRAQLALGTAEYNKLSKAERESSEAGQELAARNKALSDNLKGLEAKIGDTRRNVGNYNEGIKQVAIVSDQATAALSKAGSQGLGLFSKELDRGSGLLGKYKQGADLVKTGLSSLKGGGETGALGFKALAAGIAATGIGLLITAFTTLLNYFTQTNEGGKLLKVALAGVGAVVNTLSSAVFSAGKYLVKLFTEPKTVAQDFLDFLKSQVINRIQAFSVILDGIENRDFKKITNGVLQFETGVVGLVDKIADAGEKIVDAAEAAAKLEAEQQKLTKQRKELEVSEVLEKGRVEELIRLSKDRTLAASQRLSKLREAGSLENELSAKNLDLTKQELDLLKQRNAAKGLTVTSDEIQEVRDKQQQYNQVLVDRNNLLASIRARQSRFILEERAEAAKAAEDRIKEALAVTEAQILNTREGSKERLELEKKRILQQAELEKAAQNKSAADRKLITAKALIELVKQDEEYEQQRQDAAAKQLAKEDAARIAAYNSEQKRKDDEAKEQDRLYNQDIAALEKYLNRRKVTAANDYRDGKLTKEQYEREITAAENSALTARLVLTQHYNKDTSALELQRAQKQVEATEKVREKEKELNKQRIKEAEQLGQEVGKLFVDTLTATGLSLQEFAGKVLILILDTLEKTVLAAQAEATANSLGPDPTPLGLVQAAFANAAIVAAFTGAKAAITASTEHPFNTGGIVPGKGNTDSVPAILTPGEVVINKAASTAYAPLLSYLNSQYGGADFAPGFTPTTPARTFDGGLMERRLGAENFDYEKYAEASAKHPIDVNYVAIDSANAKRKARLRRVQN